MASLIKNGNNYGLIWSDSSRSPKQKRESLKTDSRHRAKKKKKELEWKYVNKEHDPWKRKWYEREREITPYLSNLIETYISYKAKARGHDGWNNTTAYNSAAILRKFYKFKNMPVGEIAESNIEDFLYRDKINSDHTRRSYIIKINAFLNWAKQQGYINERPKYRTKPPQSKVPKFLYPKELKTLIDFQLSQMEGDRAPCWIIYGWMILAGTGMRPSELAQTKLSHITGNSILIGEDYTVKVRKQRTVPLLFEAKSAVGVLKRVRSLDCHMKDSSYLLGRAPRYVRSKLSRQFSRAWKACYPNKPKKTLYNLKDLFAVRFLCDESLPTSEGLKLYDLMKILGHANLSTTQKYLKAIPYNTRITGTIWTVI